MAASRKSLRYSRSSGFWSRGEFVSNGRISAWSPPGPQPGPGPPQPSAGPPPARLPGPSPGVPPASSWSLPTRPASPMHKWGYSVLKGRVVRSGDSWKLGHGQGGWQAVRNDQADSYSSTPLAPVVYGMAACGILPLALRTPRLPHRHAARSSMLYCCVVFVVCTASQTLVWRDQWQFVFDSTAAWDDRLFALEVLIYLSPQLFAPYVWLCAPVFRDILRDFAQYEALHTSLTSTSLTPRWVGRRRLLRRLITFSCFSCATGILVGINFLQQMRIPMRHVYIPAAFASLMMQLFVTLFFNTHHYQMCEAARALNAQLDQIATTPVPADSEPSRQAKLRAIRDTRRLWVALRTLYNGTNYRFIDVFQMLHLFISLLLALYMIHVFLPAGVFFNAFIEISFFAVMLLQLAFITNGAHNGIEEMYGPVVGALDKLSMDADDPQMYRAASLFYQSVIACPATISLSGFTTVGRPLFTSVISATMTYIVIMLQFQQDKNTPPTPQINATVDLPAR